MLIINSNLTNREAYSQYGKLTDERMEALFEVESAIDNLSGGECYVQEAIAQFPDEDFLEVVIENLQATYKKLRGDNKENLKEVIESLEDLQISQARATEYAVEELNKLTKLLETAC